MATIDSSSLHCSAQGCIYKTDPGTLGLFCARHWELLPRHIKNLLRHEDQKCEPNRRSERWLRLCIVAVQSVAYEEASARLREDRGWLPKSTELEAFA